LLRRRVLVPSGKRANVSRGLRWKGQLTLEPLKRRGTFPSNIGKRHIDFLPSTTKNMSSPDGSATDSSQESTPPQVEFSREETIAAIKDFYDFVTKMYVDEGAFESPPEGGWPGITRESMKNFGKTDEIVELLRHLPYPSANYRDNPELMPAMPFAAFQQDVILAQARDDGRDLRHLTEGMIYEHVPPHIGMCLVTEEEGKSPLGTFRCIPELDSQLTFTTSGSHRTPED
jgi:hypothetical protein